MSRLRLTISMSLDGFVAGPNQSVEHPLGMGGERLHEWVVPLAAWRKAHGMEGGEVSESSKVVEESTANIGATIVKPAGDTFWGGYTGYFQDLDGHVWEVAWNPQWQIDE